MSRPGFLERSIDGLSQGLEHALFSEETARRRGLLQSVDARAKIVGLLALIIATATSHRLPVLGAMWVAAAVLAVLSAIRPLELAKRVWLPVLIFSAVITSPAIFITPGRVLFAIPALHLAASDAGLRSAALLLTRVEATATFAVLLVLCTPWTRLLRALRWFRVPREAIIVLGMTYRYIFLLLETAHEMFLARRSRLAGRLAGAEGRRMASAGAGVLMQRTLELSHEVHLAMLARGFRGEVYLLDEKRMRLIDYFFAAALLVAAVATAWVGR